MMAMAMSAEWKRPAGETVPRVGGVGDLDAARLAQCRSQDPVAFRAFVVCYERMVFALLSRMLGPGPEVEDLAQETFVRAYRAFPAFDPDGPAKVSTWLLTIATRLALDSRKRRRLFIQSTDERAGDSGAKPIDAISAVTPETSLTRRELGVALSRAAAELPDDQRAALVLSEMHGLTIAEIAGALEVPENTVKTRLFRAREKMRAALSAEWRTS
jgi:RNA polymerase sigma-70 factor (ECF subfamily)